jgi:adenylate cyclase
MPNLLSSFKQSLKQSFKQSLKPTLKQSLNQSTAFVLLLAIGSAGLVTIARKHVGFEMVELQAYDRMMRWKPSLGIDPRILLVEIDENDLQTLKTSTPSDATLAHAFQKLQRHQPRVIGLDLYRDLPQGKGQNELLKALIQPNVISIYRLGNDGSPAIALPPNVSGEQSGFNDLVVDRDGVVRRSLLFAESNFSFSLQLALKYLAKDGIEPQESKDHEGVLELGKTTFVPLEASSGAYHNLDASGHQILLKYRAKQIAHSVSLLDVLNDKVNPDWIKDKIILIGNASISGKDFFYTVYSAQQNQNHLMSGVAVHGQSVSQILDVAMGDRTLIQFLPVWSQHLWLLICAVAAASITWKIKNPLKLGAVNCLFLFSIGTGSYLLFDKQALWVPITAPISAALLAQASTLLYRTQITQRQSRMAMTLLGQNTSQAVADALWENRHHLIQSGKLPGQSLTATMIFTDLQGFSSISEKLSPSELMNWLNEYLSVVTELVHSHHGIVNKFTGDGIFAVFGVPIPRMTEAEIAEDAQNAVQCAIAFQRSLRQLNATWQAQGLGSINMRVGICTGEVVVGSLGGKNRMEYGIIGDAVNTASRLESCAKEHQIDDCRILVSESTQKYLAQMPIEDWGPMALRGKQEMVKVYRVLTPLSTLQPKVPEFSTDNYGTPITSSN